MNNQQGFSLVKVLLIMALVSFSFYAGAISQKLPVSNILQLISRPVEIAGNDFEPSLVRAEQVTMTPQNITKSYSSSNADNYQSSTNQDKITISGNFTIPDNHRTAYNFSFVKNGGPVTGSLKGTCNGQITGQSGPQGEDQKANFTGLLEAKCDPMVGFSWKIDMKANLEGLIDYQSGKIQVIYDFSQPYPLRGSTDINFTSN